MNINAKCKVGILQIVLTFSLLFVILTLPFTQETDISVTVGEFIIRYEVHQATNKVIR